MNNKIKFAVLLLVSCSVLIACGGASSGGSRKPVLANAGGGTNQIIDADSDGADSVDNRQLDQDGDGVTDSEDNCPDVANADGQNADIDNDGIGDACDSVDNRVSDADGDGIADSVDNCPAVANPEQLNRYGGSAGDACEDSDGDGVLDAVDNCPLQKNSDQGDKDNNGLGDVCDGDVDAANELALKAFFIQTVHPSLADCRLCHLPNGVADTDDGKRFQLLANADAATEYAKLYSDWQGLGAGVETNQLLTKPSNSDANDPHTGGQQWPREAAEFQNMRSLLSCWDNIENCSIEGVVVADKLPLLGSKRGGHLWYDYCEAKGWPANEPLPRDPRAQIMPGVNQGDWTVAGDEAAVYFNAFWKNCHIDEDGDGVPEHLAATAEGVITEKAHPQNCGQLQLSIERGKVVMGVRQLPAPEVLPDCSLPENIASSPYCNTFGELIRPGSTFAAYDHDNAGAIAADAYNLLYKVWDPTAQQRPQNFDRIAAERYGMGWDDKVDNPYPLPGEDPNDPTSYVSTSVRNSKGGSGQLPVGLIQLRDPQGNYSGNIGINCQACHGITIASDFVWGGGGAMLDLGTFGADMEAVNLYYTEYLFGGNATTDRPVGIGFGLDRVGVAGRTRGTNNAQFSNVTAAIGAISSEDGGSLLFTKQDPSGVIDVFTSGSTATGDTPAWWNVGHRTMKFVDGMTTGDAVRVDMALFFPLFDFVPSVPAGCDPADVNTWPKCGEEGAKAFNTLSGGALPYTPEAGNCNPADFTTWMSCGQQGMSEFQRMMSSLLSPGGSPDSEPQNRNQFEAAVRWVGENAQYADHWLMTLKSPEYPLAIDEKRAEAGAILFHKKDLWEGRADAADISEMRAKGYTGNGSCASCHGAYSPRYVNDTAYLEDAALEGIAAYVVPIRAIATDRVRFDTYMGSSYSAAVNGETPAEGTHHSGVNKGNSEEYIFYSETANVDPAGDAYTIDSGDCRAQNLAGQQLDHTGRERALGYVAPPLYGVWATAPYLHNGSVPSVEALLNSAARPAVWRRKSKQNDLGPGFVMGYESALSAYDQEQMGWVYEEIDCSALSQPCSVSDVLMDAAQPVVSEIYGNVLLSWNVTTPPVLSKDDVEKRKIYNTGLHSQGNGGHTFSDSLGAEERRAIIEYLKTL